MIRRRTNDWIRRHLVNECEAAAVNQGIAPVTLLPLPPRAEVIRHARTRIDAVFTVALHARIARALNTREREALVEVEARCIARLEMGCIHYERQCGRAPGYLGWLVKRVQLWCEAPSDSRPDLALDVANFAGLEYTTPEGEKHAAYIADASALAFDHPCTATFWLAKYARHHDGKTLIYVADAALRSCL